MVFSINRYMWCLVLMMLFMASARSSVDLKEYSPVTFKLTSKPEFKNSGFEFGEELWSLKDGYNIEPNGGRNGTAGLFYERSDPDKYLLASHLLQLENEKRYSFSAWVRCENIVGNGAGATICLEFLKDGKWIGGEYLPGIKGTKGWVLIKGETVIPESATECRIVPYIRKGMTGKAWFDDFRVEPVAPRIELHLVAPSFNTLTPENTKAKINIYNETSSTNKMNGKLLHIEADIGGKVKIFNLPLKKHAVEVNLYDSSVSLIKLKLKLLDPEKKLILAQTSATLNVAKPDRKTPKNTCLVDSKGRTIVDGKPYLPVGLYMGGLYKDEVDHIADSPFNCLMPYQSMSLRLNEGEKASVESIAKALDYCNSKGIKVIFSIKDVYEGTKSAKISWFGVEGETEVIKSVVSNIKDHPALLAWYINDERPISMMKRLNERRKLVNELDPYHPTWSVLYQFNDLPFYGSSCDIIGVDPYPVRDRSSKNMVRCDWSMEAADLTGLPVWAVPQIFNWGVYKANGNAEKYKIDFVSPTEEQMRSMSLLMALRGATGFVFYSYFDLKRPLSKKRFNIPPETQKDFERRWKEVCHVGKMLRGLEDFILSDKDSMPVKIEIKKGEVQAREFVDNKGNVRLMIAGIGPGDAEAIITSNTGKPLKSLYGKCELIGGNKYRFAGKDICSDILSSE